MNKLALLVFIAYILLLWVMNDTDARLNDCEKLDNHRQIEYCKLSYLKGI